MFKRGPMPDEAKQERFKEVMGWVNDFIKPTGYVAGTDHLTVADIAFLATYRCSTQINLFLHSSV